MTPPTLSAGSHGRVTLGIIILSVGLLALLNRSGLFDFDVMRMLPGAVLIALGIGRLVLRTDRDGRRGRSPIVHGLWLLTVGVWLSANMVQLFGMTFRTSWPLMLIAGGAFIMARAWEQ